MTGAVTLDGDHLSIDDLVLVARDPSVRVQRDPRTDERVRRSEELIAAIGKQYTDEYRAFEASGRQGPPPRTKVYGVTTGFGEFKSESVDPANLELLQRNLLRSHSVGVGETSDRGDRANYFPAEVVRAALLTRLNAFLKGHSGVRERLVRIVEAMLNCGIIPLVPLRGSVGASGDLCPLAHLFVTLLGEGSFYVASAPAEIHSAKGLPEFLRREIPDLRDEELAPKLKEGLALINGANFSAGMLALAVHDAQLLVDAADTAVAFTLEVLRGRTRALDEKVHEARRHRGQRESAARIRSLLEGSSFTDTTKEVQDAYSLRCAPQVHGASRDAIDYVAGVAETEINAATDNPLFFPGEPAPDDGQGPAYSAGNFHGQPIALAADFLAIAVAELANISERRTQMMLDKHHNRGLPPDLTTRPGLNSGLMIAQYSAASLVSENKVLAHPASVDSIPTSANSEDHVSMSTHAARKLRTIMGNAQAVIAIEMLAAAQAADWRIGIPGHADGASLEASDAEAVEFQRITAQWETAILPKLAPKLQPVYRKIRERVPAIVTDRVLDEDVRLLRQLIESGALVRE
jgi:histidine ammonia-lyase